MISSQNKRSFSPNSTGADVAKKLFRIPWPETYFGFPVGKANEKKDWKKTRRGVAMIIAIMIIAVMILLTSDLIVNSRVELSMALAQRDGLKAEYLAKSGMNFAIFLLTADYALDTFLAQQGQAAAALGIKPGDNLGDIWGMLNDIPIGGGTMELMKGMQDKFNLDALNDSTVLDEMKALDGDFTMNIGDESGKINLNLCVQGRCTEVLAMLQALFNCPVERSFLDSKKIDGTKMAYKIRDFIFDKDEASPESGVTDKSSPYQNKNPPYKPKNGPFDSLDELKMVDEWDDEMHAVFSPYFTIFPFQVKGDDKPTININTAPKELLTCLIPESRSSACAEKSALALKSRDGDKTGLTGEQNLQTVLKDVFCLTKEQAGDRQTSGDRSKWFSESSSVFRIEAHGESNDQTKKIVAYIQRVVPDKKQTFNAYKLLFWKMM